MHLSISSQFCNERRDECNEDQEINRSSVHRITLSNSLPLSPLFLFFPLSLSLPFYGSLSPPLSPSIFLYPHISPSLYIPPSPILLRSFYISLSLPLNSRLSLNLAPSLFLSLPLFLLFLHSWKLWNLQNCFLSLSSMLDNGRRMGTWSLTEKCFHWM